MPISEARVRLGVLLAALALAACEAGFGAPERIAVAGGAVQVAGPAGYCVDRRLTRDGPEEAFVVLGSCAALSAGGPAPDATPAVLTATISASPAASPTSPATLERFLRSPAGRAALSRSGRAASVSVLQARREGGVLMLYIRDTSPAGGGPQVGADYHRAVFDVNGRLVTATVMAFADQPLSADAGFRTLAAFVARFRAQNPPAPPAPAEAPS